MSQFAAQPAASVMPEELLYGVDGETLVIHLPRQTGEAGRERAAVVLIDHFRS